MNTKNLKAHAPKARRQFMEAVAKRAAHFGIYEDEIAPVSFQGSTAIIEGNAFTKQQGEQRKRLEKRIEEKPLATHKERYDLFVREMAYTWFNRLAALRYMELHDYFEHGFRVLSNPSNQDGLPEILDHAADVADMLGLDKAQIIEWQLSGDKQELLYRELLLGQCHHLHNVMPFLFEAIDDATELLLPDNLTKTDSILKGLVNDIPEEDWEQIEVIGWLYQFYISEHKDAVIGKVVKSEDIPAATQLFTPNWIVKYLVQNSIGRQWLATYPDSSIKAKMEYYIEPAEQTDDVNDQLATITPSSIDPESIKALDPACGSGHILVEMYELLREIYLERGYRLREIPELILTKNIYGLDIDDRAAQLAGFALLMKAREDDRRIFQRVQDGSVKLNVYALQPTEGWDSSSLWQSLNIDGKAKQGSSGDLFAENGGFEQPTGEYAEYFDLLKYLFVLFDQAKTLGSLIQIEYKYLPKLEKFKAKLLDKLQETDPAAIAGTEQLLPVVEQAIILAQKYDAVIANPPYMAAKSFVPHLKKYLKENYLGFEKDLFSAFIIQNFNLTKDNGHTGVMTSFVWMFISSFQRLREYVLANSKLESLIQLHYDAFTEAKAHICTFMLRKKNIKDYLSSFVRLADFPGEKIQHKKTLEAIKDRDCGWFYVSNPDEFLLIPNNPVAYWVDNIELFSGTKIGDSYISGGRNKTHDNEKFLRYWWEVNDCDTKWVPYCNGGEFRKYYGNEFTVINWSDEARKFYDSHGGLVNPKFWNQEGITWSLITSALTGFRIKTASAQYSSGSPTIFNEAFKCDNTLLAFLNSKISHYYLKAINATLNTTVNDVFSLPYLTDKTDEELVQLSKKCLEEYKLDWNMCEISDDFRFPLATGGYLRSEGNVAKIYKKYKVFCEEKLDEMLEVEKRINEIFIRKFELENSLHPNIPPEQITLNINPYYLYKNRGQSSIENWARFQSDFIVSVISFFVGCVMGRFSLDKEKLVFSDSYNHDLKEMIEKGDYFTYLPDNDGITPLSIQEWLFEDDATTCFSEFVKLIWGAEHLQENIEFMAESLCLNAIKPKKDERAIETIRRYFSTQFFADHCKLYKKRPIYWLFSSGKEKAFECLVYLHRYNEATLSRMRTEYVTPLMGKYEHQLARKTEEVVEATSTEQRRIEKEIKELEKKQAELRKFDEELKHYAEMRISLDLDDGVKANYGKFGNLLANVKAIHGKAVK